MRYRTSRPAFILIIILCVWYVKAAAQDVARYSGSKTPYHRPAKHYTAPPKGFTPVFVNYVGRHGARFLTRAGSDSEVLELLLLAEKNNALTARGRKIKAMTERFLLIEKNNYENITLLGREEQTGIGERILHNYGLAFKGRGLETVTTYKIRTQQSADAFLKAFTAYKGKRHYQIVADSMDNNLRFYDLSPAYLEFKKSAAVRLPVDSLTNDKRTQKTAADICAAVFTKVFTERLVNSGITMEVNHKRIKADAISFAENLYDLYCVQFSIPGEMQQKGYTRDSINFSIAFRQEYLQWLAFKNGAEDFLEKGAGTDSLGIQVRVAVPLLADFINSTEAAVHKTASADAILRFTHAEAIAPFAALLGLPETSSPSLSIYQYNRHWRSESIIPLSANIQWIVYSNGKECLLKVLLNEKETALPVKTTHFPYYRWEDVKKYYCQKLEALNTGLHEDMHRYLTELK